MSEPDKTKTKKVWSPGMVNFDPVGAIGDAFDRIAILEKALEELERKLENAIPEVRK